MDQRDFNRDMGSYLRERKSGGKSFFSRIVPKVEIVSEDKQPPKPEEVPREHVEAVLRGESVPHEDDDFELAEPEHKSWWKRMFGSRPREAVAEDDVDLSVLSDKKPSVDSDVKEMLRICVQWVNRLPSEEIQEIRRSDEYVEFKRLLDKYGLIKK